jgi:hypothetical protein
MTCGGVGGDPGEVHAADGMLNRHHEVEAAQEDGVDVGDVDREERVCLRRQVGPDRCGAGSMPAVFRIFRVS